MATILIIDDNHAIGQALTVLLELHGLAALTAVSPAEGLLVLERENVDLVIQDMNFTGNDTSGAEGAGEDRSRAATRRGLHGGLSEGAATRR